MRRQAAAAQSGWRRWLPGIDTLSRYEAGWLPHDIVAGIVLTTMLVPVGIAYAVASGVPGIYGLYATIVPLLAYALFGPSRILVLGPDSSLAAVILAVVVPLSAGDPQRAVALAGVMAIVSGVVCIVAGVARLGFVTELLSKPIRYGYMNGIALTVLISQLPKLFGFSIESDGPLRQVWAIVAAVLDGQDELGCVRHRRGDARGDPAAQAQQARAGNPDRRRRAPRWSSARSTWRRAPALSVLGPLPQGLPAFAIPLDQPRRRRPGADRRLSRSRSCRSPTPACSRAPMRRGRGTHVDPNQEMVGLGAANLAAGFFQGFPISSSSSRTPVAEAAGARTQLTGVVGALAVALLLVLAPDLLQHLPTTALAAVVIASAIGLIEVADLRRIYRIQRWEFWLSIVCFAGVAVLGAIPGIGLAIVIAVIEFLWDGWRPHSAVLGRVGGRQGLSRHHALSRRAPDPGPGAVSLGCAAVLRQRRVVPRPRARCRGQRRRRRCAGWSSPPSRSPASTSPPPTCSPSWTRPCTRRASSCASPR